ncbi:hypothetical protein Hanom_Chr13g01226851 [Helianthus anomalus]
MKTQGRTISLYLTYTFHHSIHTSADTPFQSIGPSVSPSLHRSPENGRFRPVIRWHAPPNKSNPLTPSSRHQNGPPPQSGGGERRL